MANRFEHLLILLPWLYAHSGVSVEEARAEFGRTEKEFYEDLTLLTLVGVGQYATEQFEIDWHDGHIYVYDNLGLDRAFRFDSMETACLLVGLELIEQLADTQAGFTHEDVVSLKAKLTEALPGRLPIHVLEDDSIDAVVELVGQAILEKRQVEFLYDNVSRDDRTVRVVSPMNVIAVGAEPRLNGWCHSSQAWRSFRLEKISDLSVIQSPVALPETPFVEMPTQPVKISVAQDRQELLEQFEVISLDGTLEDEVVAEVAIAAPQWLARLCQAAGGDIRVIEPEAIRQEVQALLSAALDAYR